jgi:hypothetical protein
MAGLFDDFSASFDDKENSSTDPVGQVVQDINAQSEAVSSRLSEFRKRFIKAGYYETIVQNGVMDDDGTDACREINDEVKTWALQRMASLMGEADEKRKVDMPFDDREIEQLKRLAELAEAEGAVMALKLLAQKVMTAQGMAPAAPKPSVKKVEQGPPVPSVRKIVPKPPKTPPVAPAAAAPLTPPSGPKKPRKVPEAPVNAKGEIDLDKIPSGEVFKDPKDNQLYKMVDNPNFDPERPGSRPRTKMKVTAQVRGQGRTPMPTGEQLSQISQNQSAAAANTAQSANTIFPDQEFNQNLVIVAAAKSSADE